jgi:hypothetical protein
MRTVWIYIDSTKQVGEESLRVFESPGVFERWKETHDPDAIAIEYVVIDPDNVNKFLGIGNRNGAVQRNVSRGSDQGEWNAARMLDLLQRNEA